MAKNQSASDGPTVIKPVVIPALKPHLDSSLTQDRSLCPVRALKYYLDRTKDLRKNKNLLFVAIKEDFTRDISRATISSWLKQTILLAYEESDSETQQLNSLKMSAVQHQLPPSEASLKLTCLQKPTHHSLPHHICVSLVRPGYCPLINANCLCLWLDAP